MRRAPPVHFSAAAVPWAAGLVGLLSPGWLEPNARVGNAWTGLVVFLMLAGIFVAWAGWWRGGLPAALGGWSPLLWIIDPRLESVQDAARLILCLSGALWSYAMLRSVVLEAASGRAPDESPQFLFVGIVALRGFAGVALAVLTAVVVVLVPAASAHLVSNRWQSSLDAESAELLAAVGLGFAVVAFGFALLRLSWRGSGIRSRPPWAAGGLAPQAGRGAAPASESRDGDSAS